MAVGKVVVCKTHGYEGGRKGRVASCDDCTKAASDSRYLVQLYRGPGQSLYKKRIDGLRDAELHEAQMKVVLAGGGMASPKERSRTFRDLLEEILASKQTLTPATVRTYGATCKNHLWPTLGPRKLKDLERAGLQISGILEGIEVSSGHAARRTAEGLIRLTLRTAVREGMMNRNPLDGVKWPKHRRVKGVPYAPEMSDVMAIRQHILDQDRGVTGGEKEMALAQIALLIGAGTRIGELLAIDGDLDLSDKGLHVRRQIIYRPKGGYVYGPLKNTQSNRKIPLPPFALAAISTTRLRNGLKAVTLPWVAPEPKYEGEKVDGILVGTPLTFNLLFFKQRQGFDGQPIAPQSLANRLNRIGQGLSLVDPEDGTLHAHSFRHRYTSILDDAGVPQVVIDEVTGHLTGGNITRRVYTRAMDSGRAKVVPAIQGAWDEAQVDVRRAGLRAVD